MSNDPGQGSWSSICTDHLTAFSLKHLLLLLRTSFHLKSLDELTVFRRNHLPPRKREWGFCSVRAEGSLWASDTECPPLTSPFEHWPPHPAPTDLSSGLSCTTSCSRASQGPELTDPQNVNKNHIVLKRLDWGWNNSVSWGGQHRPGPPKLDKIPPLGTSQVSACPHPSQPNRSAAPAPSMTASPVEPSWQFFLLISLCSPLPCLSGSSVPWPDPTGFWVPIPPYSMLLRGGSVPWPQPSGLPASNSTLLHAPLTLLSCQAHIWLLYSFHLVRLWI